MYWSASSSSSYRTQRRSSRCVCTVLGLLLLSFALFAHGVLAVGIDPAQSASAQDSAAPQVFVVPINGTIEPGIGHFLDRSLDEAADAGATVAILDISTPGGRLDTVLEMRDSLLGSPVRTVAFVNREAFSAGALITIAANEIWMAPGAVFGAATPVIGATGEAADEKTISAVRSVFRATAEQRGLDPIIAEAMVDPAVEIDGLDSSTSLLTLTTDQALQWGYTEGVVDDLPALLATLGLSDATITEMKVSPIEHLVRWITDPLVASLLITLGLFLIIADALFAGFGIAAVAGVFCFGLFFWGHLLAGFAGWEDLLLIGIGLALIALEVFVIPGFGWAGVSGAIALAAGLFMTMIGRNPGDSQWIDDAVRAGWVIVGALALTVLGLVGLSLVVSRATTGRQRTARGIGRLALSATVDTGNTRPGSSQPGWLTRRFGGHGVVERDDLRLPRPHPNDTIEGDSTRTQEAPDRKQIDV